MRDHEHRELVVRRFLKGGGSLVVASTLLFSCALFEPDYMRLDPEDPLVKEILANPTPSLLQQLSQKLEQPVVAVVEKPAPDGQSVPYAEIEPIVFEAAEKAAAKAQQGLKGANTLSGLVGAALGGLLAGLGVIVGRLRKKR